MKNYIVTFTNDASEYDLQHQRKAIREDLKNNQNYFSDINEEISFEQIDREVESAIRNDFDNFICLAEDEDVDMLQDGLEAEYGDKFNEILVIPEEFARFTEADVAPNTAPAQSTGNGQPMANGDADTADAQQQQAGQQQTGQDYKAVLDKYFGKIPVAGNSVDYSGQTQAFMQEAGISNRGTAAYLEAAYAMTLSPKTSDGTLSVRVFKDTTYRIVLTDKANQAVAADQTGKKFTTESQLKINTLKITPQNQNGKGIQLSAQGETKVSSATNIHLILFNLSYPFMDLAVPAIQNIQSIANQAAAQENSDVLFMMCGALPNQQFLKSTQILPIASAIPDESQTLSGLIDKVFPDESCIQCGMPTADNLANAIVNNFRELCPACQSIVIHAPQSLGGIKSVEELIANQAPYKVATQVDIPADFDQSRNLTVFQALEDLVVNKENGYKKCKSEVAAKLKADEEKTQQELTQQIQGKDAKDVEKLSKELNDKTQNGPMQQEIMSGWPVFVQTLIEATIQFKKNPQEENMSQKEANAARHEFIDAVLEPLKKDAESWKTALDATGFGVMLGWAIKAGKALANDLKSKKKPEDKKVEQLKDLVLSDSYATIKIQFGGKYNKDAMLDDLQNANKSQIAASTQQAQSDLGDVAKGADEAVAGE